MYLSPSSGCVPVVGLGQLVGHGQDGQRSVLLRAKRLIDTSAVDQTPLPALYEHLAQQLLVILTVHVEGLREKTDTVLLTGRTVRQDGVSLL